VNAIDFLGGAKADDIPCVSFWFLVFTELINTAVAMSSILRVLNAGTMLEIVQKLGGGTIVDHRLAAPHPCCSATLRP
jgi:hypothetical protein